MHYCPSCGSPLNSDGTCPACGGYARSYFRKLDLGAPQIAAAVENGLDFYLLLGVAPDTSIPLAARRYRQLRALFPDDPSDLQPMAARRLDLLDVVGRTLTDPKLRTIYDQLRATAQRTLSDAVVRCAACAAPLAEDAAACSFCGTPRPSEPQPPAAPPTENVPPPTDPVDYYALLGITALHLEQAAFAAPIRPTVRSPFGNIELPPDEHEAPTPEDIDSAALARERELLLQTGLSQAERNERLDALDIACRILRDNRRREQYDQLLRDFRQGQLGGGRLDALQNLQHEARAEQAEARGEQLSADEAQALLQQGLGYLHAQMYREALPILGQAVRVMRDSPAAHAAYVEALFAADEPIDLGGHALRQALASLEALEHLGTPLDNSAALVALCRGLLARDNGDIATATAELRRCVQLNKHSAAGWRGLAALALARGDYDDAQVACRRALACEPRHERTLLMLVAACLRNRQQREAREAAAQIAQIRGAGWSADDVLHEFE